MNPLISKLTGSPVLARVAPFLLFILLTFVQGHAGGSAPFWIYFAKTLVTAWLLWLVRGAVSELRWHLSWEAVVVGVGVFVLWIGLDVILVRLGFPNSYPKLSLNGAAWNPHVAFGQGTGLAWFFLLVRVLGSSLVVPLMEEVFFRSFLYRFIARSDFLSVPLGAFLWFPFLAASSVFGAEHREWLAGILSGFAYQALVCRKKRLGDAITAHALTNFLLGLWVIWQGAWQYW
jgi:CAAX prenyl protease-like protein